MGQVRPATPAGQAVLGGHWPASPGSSRGREQVTLTGYLSKTGQE